MIERFGQRLPANIPEIVIGNLKIFASVASSQQGANDISERIRYYGRNDTVQIPVDNNILVLTTEGVETFSAENPYKTGSPSDAVYLARRKDESGEFLIQYLQPGQRTSHHKHPYCMEIYQKLAGDLLICRRAKEVMKLETKTIINQNESHIAFANSKPAITLILLFGSNTKHVQLPRPSFKFLLNKAVQQQLV